MANTIRHKRSATTTAVPSAGSLSSGEMAINTADGIVFTKKDNGTVVEVGSLLSDLNVTQALTTVDFSASGIVQCDSIEQISFGDLGGNQNGTVFVVNDSTNTILIGTTAPTAYATVVTVDGSLSLAPGSTTRIPVTVQSGVVATTPVAGGVEYNGKAFFTTPVSGRGVSPSVMLTAVQADFTLVNGTAAQNAFPIPQDTITTQTSTTYFFEGQYIINSGTTTHITSMSFSGTSVIAAMNFTTVSTGIAAPPVVPVRAQDTNYFAAAAGGNINATSVSPYTIVTFQGMLRVTTGGTLIPQITFSAAPGNTNLMKAGSYMRLYPIGAVAVTVVGNIA